MRVIFARIITARLFVLRVFVEAVSPLVDRYPQARFADAPGRNMDPAMSTVRSAFAAAVCHVSRSIGQSAHSGKNMKGESNYCRATRGESVMYTTDLMERAQYFGDVVQQSSGAYGNRILDALSPSALEGLAPFLDLIALERRQELVRPHEAPHYVYFPLSCVISWLSTLRSGATIEVATIGNEGLVGSPMIHGGQGFPFLVMNQVPGTALRVPVDTFRAVLRTDIELADALELYSHAFMVQVAQSGACNGLHGVGARCARWLLMTQDRVGSAAFSMTHELLADMLGVARPTVTEAIGELHARGAVRSSAGQVQVLDRSELEAASCECYAIIAAAYGHFGVPPLT